MYLTAMMIYSAQIINGLLIYLSMILMLLMTCVFLSVLPHDVDHQLGELDVECLKFAKNRKKVLKKSVEGRVKIKTKMYRFIRFYSDSMQ